jgi:hypothetical protein
MRHIGVLVVTAAVASPAGADIVFNSFGTASPGIVIFSHDTGEISSIDEQPGGRETESQSGQRITLAAGPRQVTQIEVRLLGIRGGPPVSATVSLDMTLRIFGVQNGAPGALLWEGTSDLQTLVIPATGPYPVIPLSFSLNALLPDDVILSVSHAQLSGQGPSFVGNAGQFQAPSVGTATDWWSQDTFTGDWTSSPADGVFLQARVTAVPAPGALVCLGIAAFAARRRGGRRGDSAS